MENALHFYTEWNKEKKAQGLFIVPLFFVPYKRRTNHESVSLLKSNTKNNSNRRTNTVHSLFYVKSLRTFPNSSSVIDQQEEMESNCFTPNCIWLTAHDTVQTHRVPATIYLFFSNLKLHLLLSCPHPSCSSMTQRNLDTHYSHQM